MVHLVGGSRTSDLVRVAVATFAIVVILDVASHGHVKLLHGSSTLLWARGLVHLGAYLAIYAIAVVSVVSVVLSQSRAARIVGLAVILATLTVQIAHRLVVGDDVSMHSLQLMWADRGVATETLVAFRTQLVQAALLAILATGLVAGTVWLTPCRLQRKTLVSVPIALCAVTVFCYRLVGTTYLSMPIAVQIPVNAAMAAAHTRYAGPRTSPDIVPRGASDQARIVLLIVDESIRPDSLGINGRRPDTTPFLETWSGLMNLGTACAPSNVSSTSNYVIRNGITPSELPDVEQVGLKRPSVFAFAKAAGYQTVLLDAQGVPGRFVNYMHSHDLDVIDQFWSPRDEFPDVQPWELDRVLLRHLAEVLRRNEKLFIWVNKWGAHFPYQTCVPPDRLAAAAPSLGLDESLSAARSEAVWNTYLAAVRYSVDDFLCELSQQASLDEVEIVYVGDHGQSILEGDYPTTHGVVENPPVTQVEVPLLLRGRIMTGLMSGRVESSKDRCSSFAIFPSLLELMNYSPDDVRVRFGQPLWGDIAADRCYFTGDCFGIGRHFTYVYKSSGER